MGNKKTAKERIEELEDQVQNLHQSNVALATNAENLRMALLEISEKLNAVIALSEADQPINEQNVSDQRKNRNIKAMEAQVEGLLAAGALVKSKVVGSRSFVVITETDKTTGELIQPRLQVSLMNMPAEMRQDFLGKSVGETIDKENIAIEIIELYDIVEAEEEAREA